ncbi:hypothetical protein WJX81_003723 [Elliptochloris bilobata]|uniref:Uncharacterized protein n=1 Tax=Elliptochloris bilobata TaxID=381761 RepID=A0AAW1R1H0_9CHLO
MTVTTLQATRSKQADVDPNGALAHKRKAGTLTDIAEVIQESGWRGLFNGLQPSLVGTAVSQGVYFYLYSVLRQLAIARHQRRTRTSSQDMGIGPSLLVALLAGCGNVLLTNPIWSVATRMQAHRKRGDTDDAGLPPGVLTVCREIYQEGGVQAFWKGVLPSLVMVSNPSVNYMFFEYLTARLADWRRAESATGKAPRASPGDVFFLSAAAKLGATVLTYPILMVKTRLQSEGKHTTADRRYNGSVDAVTRIWQTEGLPGFYKGMRTKIVQSILAAALLMAIKEEISSASHVILAKSAAVLPAALPLAAAPTPNELISEAPADI